MQSHVVKTHEMCKKGQAYKQRIGRRQLSQGSHSDLESLLVAFSSCLACWLAIFGYLAPQCENTIGL